MYKPARFGHMDLLYGTAVLCETTQG